MFTGSLIKIPSFIAAIIIVLASAGFCDAGSYSFNASLKPHCTFFSSYKPGYSFSIGPKISFADSYGITWSDLIRITNSPIDKNRPSIIQTPSFGPLQVITNWIFWQSNTNDLYYALSHDGKGMSWSTGQPLVTTGDNYRPASAVVRDGSPYSLWLAWSSLRSGSFGYDIYSKSFSENQPFAWQWSIDERMDCSRAAIDEDPSIIRDSDGTIWIAWSSNKDGNFDIFLANSANGGLNWNCAIPQLGGIGSSNEMYPSLAEITVSGMKRILIAYQSDKDGDNEIYCDTYDPVSNSLIFWDKITNNGSEDIHPTILRKQNEEFWIAWENKKDTYSPGDIYYAISQFNGQLWGSAVDISKSSDKDDRYPSMTQTWDGKVWIVWSTNRVTNYEIYGRYGK